MEFKSNTKKTKISIEEWSDVDAYVKDLTTIERMVYSDLVARFCNESEPSAVRATAGAEIAVMALVDADGNPLLTAEDVEQILNTSFSPIGRVIDTITQRLKDDSDKGTSLKKA